MNAKRKLAAILSADAVGYLRLMADDEAETLRALIIVFLPYTVRGR